MVLNLVSATIEIVIGCFDHFLLVQQIAKNFLRISLRLNKFDCTFSKDVKFVVRIDNCFATI